jgi:hypothetical protein
MQGKKVYKREQKQKESYNELRTLTRTDYFRQVVQMTLVVHSRTWGGIYMAFSLYCDLLGAYAAKWGILQQ